MVVIKTHVFELAQMFSFQFQHLGSDKKPWDQEESPATQHDLSSPLKIKTVSTVEIKDTAFPT